MRRGLFLVFLLSGISLIVGCGSGERREATGADTPVERLWAEMVPVAGTATDYGIPLSFGNAQRFIDWYRNSAFTPSQAVIREEALAPLVAPCCDRFPMSTCCCVCNLSRSIWGLSAYLIEERGTPLRRFEMRCCNGSTSYARTTTWCVPSRRAGNTFPDTG